MKYRVEIQTAYGAPIGSAELAQLITGHDIAITHVSVLSVRPDGEAGVVAVVNRTPEERAEQERAARDAASPAEVEAAETESLAHRIERLEEKSGRTADDVTTLFERVQDIRSHDTAKQDANAYALGRRIDAQDMWIRGVEQWVRGLSGRIEEQAKRITMQQTASELQQREIAELHNKINHMRAFLHQAGQLPDKIYQDTGANLPPAAAQKIAGADPGYRMMNAQAQRQTDQLSKVGTGLPDAPQDLRG